MYATTRLKSRRVSSEAADRRLPHLLWWNVEDQRGIHRYGQPGGRGNFLVELTRTPSGIADDEARSAARRRLQHLQHERLRRRDDDAWRHLLLLIARLFGVAHQHPGAMRLHGTADPEAQLGIHRHWRLGLDHRPGRFVHLPVDDEPERS